tara:strand:+ start:5890 stop:6717 length:828 start_codon:yes stop_codon:yes gene_type:complete
MKNLLTVVQTLAVSTLVAILVASATVYILSPRISEQIDSVERKAVTQYQKVTDSFQEIDNALSERIDYSLQRSYEINQDLVSLNNIVGEQTNLVSEHLEKVEGRVETLSVDASKDHAMMASRSRELNNEVSSLLLMIQELSNKVSSIQFNHNVLFGEEDLVNEPILKEEPVNESISEPVDKSLAKCPAPTEALNRKELLSDLQRRLQNINATSRQDIKVWFDITTEGVTNFKNAESGTASQSLVNAVQKYVGALVFEESDNAFTNCEMTFKFNIT